MSNFLDRPYFLDERLKSLTLRSIGFGGFIFLFLYVFKPFGLYNLPQGLLTVTLAYGAVTTVIMFIIGFFGIVVFPRFYTEEKWTVGREIFWNLLNIFFIGLGNLLLTHYFGFIHLSWEAFVYVQAITLVVGLLPVGFFVLMKESSLRGKYAQSAANMSQYLVLTDTLSRDSDKMQTQETVLLPSQNKDEDLLVAPENIWYIRASDNYVEVHFKNGKVQNSRLLRATLKQMEDALSGDERFFRCHKSYLVNLEKVTTVRGNAQGYRLHLADREETIPVSRQHNEVIKERLGR